MHWRDYLSKFNFIVSPHKNKTLNRPRQSFCLSIIRVDFPDFLLDNLNDLDKIAVKTSLFDFTKHKFYGKQWKSSFHVSGDLDTCTLELDERLYFYTSNMDESVALVFEVVAIQVDGQEKSLGWTVFNLFRSETKVVDLNSNDKPDEISVKFFKGSPRALFHLTDPVEKNALVKSYEDFQLDLELYTHEKFEICHRLLPEDYLLHEDDILPGLAINQQSSDGFEQPILAEFNCYLIDNVTVVIEPMLVQFEQQLLHDVNLDRINRNKKAIGQDPNTLKIVERRLRVGVHNGFVYTEDTNIVFLNVVDPQLRRVSTSPALAQSTKNTMSASNAVEVYLPVDQPQFVLIFILEYVIAETIIDPDHKIIENNKTTTTKANKNGELDKHQCGTTAPTQHTYPLRWTSFQPFPQQSADGSLAGGIRLELDLTGGSVGAPDNKMFYKTQVPQDSTSQNEVPAADQEDDSVDFPGQSRADTVVKLNAIFREKMKEDDKQTKPVIRQKSEHELDMTSQQIQAQYEAQLKPKSRKSKVGISTEAPPVKPKKLDDEYDGDRQLQKMQHQSQDIQFTQPLPSYHQQPYPPMVYPYYPPMWSAQLAISRNENTADYQQIEPYVLPQDQQQQLTESGYRPAPPGLRPIQTRSHSGLGLTRAIYSRIHAAGFPDILDAAGDHPFVVEPLNDDDGLPANFSLEQKDHRQSNEIIFQFMAFSLFGDMSKQKIRTNSVYFTMQFYRFPIVSTDRMRLEKVNNNLSDFEQCSTYILHRIQKGDKSLEESPGMMLKYLLDPAYMSPGEMFSFLEYLSEQVLHIDVWNGESLMLIGSCGVNLKYLLRQGKSSVQAAYELDVINDIEIDNEGVSELKGRLHIRMANLGSTSETNPRVTVIPHPKKGVFVDATKFENPGSSRSLCKSLLVHGSSTDDLADMTNGLARVNTSGVVVRPQPAEHRSRELSLLLSRTSSNHMNQSAGDYQSNGLTNNDRDRLRKLDKYNAVLKVLENPDYTSENEKLILQSRRNEVVDKMRKLRTIEIYRQQEQPDLIKKMLSGVVQKDMTLYPKFGTTELFEVKIKNHFNEDHNVQIEISEESNTLAPVTNATELRALKALYNVTTASEDGLITYDKRNGHHMVFMRAKESVVIPFKFTNLYVQYAKQSVDQNIPDMQTKSMKPHNKLSNVDMESFINFRVQSTGKLLSTLRLVVVPQPAIIDQSFRFYHPEQSFLKRMIRLPPIQFMSSGSNQTSSSDTIHTSIRSSDPEVLAECKHVPLGTPHDVFVKVPCGPAPQVRDFLVAVYVDRYLLRPVQVWGFSVHSQHRIDVVAPQGQITPVNVLIRGTTSTHRVHVYTSHPTEISIGSTAGTQTEPQNESFVLAANTVYELGLGLSPLRVGNRSFQLNLVDVETHSLVRSWTICAICKDPDITKFFEITLPILHGGNAPSLRKKISFLNAYSYRKRFYIHTDRPDLLTFKETLLNIEANETENIGIIFFPVNQVKKEKIYVFINDEEGKNEETMALIVNYQ